MGELVLMGLIIDAHGLDGAVKIKSFTERPSDLVSYGPLFDGKGDRPFALKPAGSPKKNILIARIEGIAHREAAEALKGQELYAKRASMPALEAEQFYQADLIGLDVKEEGQIIGKVIAVENYGAGDLLTWQTTDGGQSTLPFTKAFFPLLDIDQGFIQIHRPIEIMVGEIVAGEVEADDA